MEHFNRLAPSQAERLALLIEELGEALHACGKILRHGYSSTDPTMLDGPHNQQMLEKELGDIQFAIELLCCTNDLSEERIDNHRGEKALQSWRWMHHQEQARKFYTHRFPATIEK